MAPRAGGKIVVALDIGTTRSSWAFFMKGHDEDSITVRVPKGASTSDSSDTRTDTAVLFSSEPPHHVEAFGRAAIKLFIERSEKAAGRLGENGAKTHCPPGMLFGRLGEELDASRGYQSVDEPVATALGGQKRPMLTVLVAILRHFKEDVLANLPAMPGACQGIEDVIWVIAVQATCDSFAKHFMRLAAHKAGLVDEVDSPQLQLCLESDAACLAVSMKDAAPLLTHPDTKVMILDCGGGTVDITTPSVVSVHPAPSLAQILPPAGGPWCG